MPANMIPTDPVSVLIAINGLTLLSVVTIGFRIARHLGKVENMFDLMWADYIRRLGIPTTKDNAA